MFEAAKHGIKYITKQDYYFNTHVPEVGFLNPCLGSYIEVA